MWQRLLSQRANYLRVKEIILHTAFIGFRRDFLVLFFAVTSAIAIIPIFTYVYFASYLKSEETITNHNNTGLILLDKDGGPFFSFYQARIKKDVPFEQMPKNLREAVISAEDKEFYSHPGFSIAAIVRSAKDDIENRGLDYGGSTITQQLVKFSLLNPSKSFLRKYQEIVLASEIDRRYPKDKILEMYLNSAYFGAGAFGVESAAQTYFGKSTKDLDLSESALITGLLPAPTRFSPISGDLQAAKDRQSYVLNRMKDQGYITEEQKKKAEEEKLEFHTPENSLNKLAPHFALMVRDRLIREYGEEKVVRSGFVVRTTLNSQWQEYAEQVVSNQVKALAPNNVTNGSAVALDPVNGEIRVMVGSTNWYDDKFGKVNIALSNRQPGSSFKPIVYLAAFEDKKITPGTVLHDQPTTFKNYDESVVASYSSQEAALRALSNDPNAYYKPVNYDRKFRGNVLPRRALANSLNVPSVEVMSKVGVPRALDEAKKLGISTLESPSDYGLSLVLGTGTVKLLEMTDVYATLANRGLYNPPTSIIEIKDKYGNSVYQYHPEPKEAADPQAVFLITSILSDNKTREEVFGNTLTISRPAAVKTGTTEDYRDAWTLGYTPDIAVGAWVGNNDNEAMDRVAGSLGAAPIWKQLIEKFSEGTPVKNFDPPAGIAKLSICAGNGLRVREATSSALTEYFLPGTEPTAYCNTIKPVPSPQPSTSPSPEPKKEDDKKKDKQAFIPAYLL